MTRPSSATASRCARAGRSARATTMATSHSAPNRKLASGAAGRGSMRPASIARSIPSSSASSSPVSRSRTPSQPGIALAGVGGRQLGRQPLDLALENRLEQLPLALEVVVHGALGDTRLERDRVERCGAVPVLGEQLAGGRGACRQARA